VKWAWNVGTKIAFGFGLALAIFLLVGLASHVTVTDMIRASELRRHTFNVLDQLDQTQPLVNAVELGTRNYYMTGDEAFLAQARAAGERMPAMLVQLRQLTADNPRQQQRLDTLEPLVRARLEHAWESAAIYRSDGLKAVMERVRTGRAPALNAEIGRLLGDIQAEERTLLKQRSDASDRSARRALWTILGGTVLALLLALGAGYLITRDISRPLRQLTECAERVAAGDIALTVPAVGRSDEVGVLARAFERMTHYLSGMAAAAEQLAAGDLRSSVTPKSAQDALGQAFTRMTGSLRAQIGSTVEAVRVLGTAAREIVASTSQLASSASESAAAVAQTTATVEEVRQTAELSSQKARHVSDSAQRAVQESESGRQSAVDVGAGMERIRQQMDGISAGMARLAQHGQTIGRIIATVEELAVQSNLLAVNAAIEAAKAGDQGKGFHVVAQEVKSLAAQSRQATAEVRSVLGEIQAATAAAVQVTREGGAAVEAGHQHTAHAGEAIQALAESIHQAAQASLQIAASSQQQLVGVDQVAGAMDSIKQASSQNMVSARQLEAAARELDALGRQLQQIVANYQL